MDSRTKLSPSSPAHKLRSLYLRNLSANLFGAVTIALLNAFTPLGVFKMHNDFVTSTQGKIGLLVFFPLVIAVSGSFQFHLQRPIARILSLSSTGKNLPVELIKKARQRLLNLPFFIFSLNLATYILVPAVITLMWNLFLTISVETCLFMFFRAFMIGLVTSGLSFFLIEEYSRTKLIPLFFPKGRLAALPGTIKLPILRRIRLLNLAGTINPMVILVVSFSFMVWELQDSAISPAELGREILVFTIVLCAIFAGLVLRLNLLVGNSILNPLKEMLNIIGKVEKGDFEQRIQVLSNDEIGALGDAGNDMIGGLADSERVRVTFGRYVTPEIRDHILAGEIPLDGERRIATLLFADLRNFTSYVEENPPEEVIRSMRAYFTAMQKAIRMHQGLVLQYIGDEIEAVFGVPLSDYGHADKAVLAAFEMNKNLEKLNALREKEGKPPFRHGIGICTGMVLAGNTGSEDRLSYTLIGDTVNLASKIQELTKTFHCDILVSRETHKRLNHSYHLKEEPPQRVKGYSRPITVFQALKPPSSGPYRPGKR